MKFNKLRSYIGFGILAAAILASFWNVISRNVRAIASDQIEIRIGHQELHTGMREAFGAAIEAYQELHPNVRIIQVPVPPRTYPAWARTQLVGGTAPDIMGLYGSQEEITQLFVPLTDEAEKPNPYNAGTHLENELWRNTFFDGMSTVRDQLKEVAPGQIYGVSLQTTSMRLYVNRDLLTEITGSDALPTEYADIYAISQKIREYNQRTGSKLIPIASCRGYADYIFDRLVGSQMQKFLIETKPPLRPWGFFSVMYAGRYKYSETPEFVSSLELMSEVAQLLTPGYQQFQPEDAIAAYLQQRSLMLVAGSWDYAVLVDRVPFETRAMPLPMPSTNDPKYGRFTLGQAAENVEITAALGVVRANPHADVAIDFLKFLTSLPIATQFSETSKRISSVVDIPVTGDLALMAAQTEGEIPGFRIDTFLGRQNTVTLVGRHIHKITGPQPDVRGFAEIMDAEMPRYIYEDIKSFHRGDYLTLQRYDAVVALHYMLPEDHPSRAAWRRYAEAQHSAQDRYVSYTHFLEKK